MLGGGAEQFRCPESKRKDARPWDYLRIVKELGGIAEAYHP